VKINVRGAKSRSGGFRRWRSLSERDSELFKTGIPPRRQENKKRRCTNKGWNFILSASGARCQLLQRS